MAVLAVALRVAVASLLVGAASLAGQRWGDRVGGWLVALPLTSGPVAFILAVDHGLVFAGEAAIGMMAGSISQLAFALAFRMRAAHGWAAGLVAGAVAFAAMTVGLAAAHWSALATGAAVTAALGMGILVVRRQSAGVLRTHGHPNAADPAAGRVDIPLRMVVASGVVLVVTTLAPVLGSHLAGLVSPFPVVAAIMAVFTHRAGGAAASRATLDGLVLGLAVPSALFFLLAVTLPTMGLMAFVPATVGALLVQAATVRTVTR